MHSRRDFLKMTTLGAAATALPIDVVSRWVGAAAAVEPFEVPLKIPPVLQARGKRDGRDLYVQPMRRAMAEIIPGRRTPIWGFNGEFPGPTFKVKRGEEIVVRRINRLNVPTTTHLHGAKVFASSDGQPMDLVSPGGHKDYVYPNDQQASTLWYHDHVHRHSSRNNYMGLSGLYIIEDDEEQDLNLPSGKFDIPLILQDRSFKNDGRFLFKDRRNSVRGDTFLVNGRPIPYLKVANRKYRFRILNASHTRGYELALDSGRPLVQIASDGGLLSAPYPATSIPIWPAERVEVIIDFSSYPTGTQVVLQHRPDPLDVTSARPIMRFDVEREEEDTSSLPPTLRPVERLTTGTVEREFILSFDSVARLWEINGKPFDHHRVDLRPRLGTTEVWTFNNQSSTTHPMHIHLIRFQILERSNVVLTPGEMGWKDTVRVDPSTTVRIAIPFEGYIGRYMFHCHNLAHEDHSMMGQMRVVR